VDETTALGRLAPSRYCTFLAYGLRAEPEATGYCLGLPAADSDSSTMFASQSKERVAFFNKILITGRIFGSLTPAKPFQIVHLYRF
jgi:hypothetical protein